jgi:signal transduction histidine kinase
LPHLSSSGRLWPAVALGALVANVTSGASLPVAAFIAVGNTLEAVVGALLLRRVAFNPRLERVRDVLALVVLAAAGSTTIAATNGVTTLWVSGNLSGSYGAGWFLWWTGDAMGDLIVAPLLLLWLSTPFWKPRRVELFEAFALLALIAVVSWFVFLHGYWRYPHLLFALLIWAALRFALTLKERGSGLVEATRTELVGHLLQQAQKLDRLLSDLLDLDRLRRGSTGSTFRATDVGALVRQVVADYPTDGHPVEVSAQPVVAEVDAPKLERIVENLVANAVKYTPPGTDVVVRVEPAGAALLIAVDDSGGGVPAAEREAVFELFNRSDA